MTAPVVEGQRFHCGEIPHGYVPVEVEQVVSAYSDLDLEIPGGDGETKLGQCCHCIILWSKRDITIPGMQSKTPERARTKSPPPPPSPRDPPSPAGHDSPGQSDCPPPPSPKPAPPSQKPPPQKRVTKMTSLAPPTQKRKTAKGKKDKPAEEKLAYDMTPEELSAAVAAEVHEHFHKKKVPEEKVTIDPAKMKFFINMSKAQKEKLHLSDYDRSLLKSYEKKKRAEKAELAKGKKKATVPMLGQQLQQPLPQMLSEYELNVQRQMRETGLTREQITGEAEVPVQTKIRWHFELGKSFVPAEDFKKLQTKMFAFHQWYMEQAHKRRSMFGCRVKDEHFFNGEETIWLEFKDIYEVYHQDALDVSLLACWVL